MSPVDIAIATTDEQPRQSALAAADNNDGENDPTPRVCTQQILPPTSEESRTVASTSLPLAPTSPKEGEAHTPRILQALHTEPPELWIQIINTNRLSTPTIVERAPRNFWVCIPLRLEENDKVLELSDRPWEFNGVQQGPGESVVAFHNTRLQALVTGTRGWWSHDFGAVGEGILHERRLRYGFSSHNNCMGVNVYGDGGLETFDRKHPGWISLEVECIHTTHLTGRGRPHRYCVRGPSGRVCEKVVLRALWVPFEECPPLVVLA